MRVKASVKARAKARVRAIPVSCGVVTICILLVVERTTCFLLLLMA